jgi:bifunctional non-homologous end joining protein LigD
VKPELVGEVSFTEWTRDGTLRHPSFQGLREDKKARDVVRERPADVADEQPGDASRPAAKSRKTAKPHNAAKSQAANAIDVASSDPDSVAGVKITNPGKLLYPEAGVTKHDVARYYAAVGELIVPHLERRPLTLVRCPEGWNKECFYQKHAASNVPLTIDRIKVPESTGTATYLMANSVTAVVALLQMGVLELHPWGAREGHLDRPDRIVFDLDPDEDLSWERVVEALNVTHKLLETLGLQSFLKTTGGKGLHLVVPVEPTVPWEDITGFTKAAADLLVRTFPDRFTAKVTKATRTGKVFVDYLRNAQGSTAIAAYSVRAKANAPVSMPIAFADLKQDVRFAHFNVRNAPALLKRRKDPWARFFDVRQEITPEMMGRVGYAPAAGRKRR